MRWWVFFGIFGFLFRDWMNYKSLFLQSKSSWLSLRLCTFQWWLSKRMYWVTEAWETTSGQHINLCVKQPRVVARWREAIELILSLSDRLSGLPRDNKVFEITFAVTPSQRWCSYACRSDDHWQSHGTKDFQRSFILYFPEWIEPCGNYHDCNWRLASAGEQQKCQPDVEIYKNPGWKDERWFARERTVFVQQLQKEWTVFSYNPSIAIQLRRSRQIELCLSATPLALTDPSLAKRPEEKTRKKSISIFAQLFTHAIAPDKFLRV